MKEKKFTMTVTQDKEGYMEIHCDNDGFNAFEILGFLKHREDDVLNQLNHPCDYKRYYVDENGKRCEIVKEGEE